MAKKKYFFLQFSMVVFVNGKILSAEKAKISLFDHGFLYGDGVYETLRTKNGEIFDFEGHFQRLQKSAFALDIPLPFSEEEILTAMKKVIAKNNFPESRIRMTLSRGENDFSFCGARNPTFAIFASPLPDFSEQRKKGVKITTIPIMRFFPEIKSTSLLPMIFAKQKAEKANAFETIFLAENGAVCEGSVSNIIFRKGKTVFSVPKEKALTGTTQKIVLKKAAEIFEVKEKKFFVSDLESAEEVLLLNSVFGILPVAQIDDFVREKVRGELFELTEKLL